MRRLARRSRIVLPLVILIIAIGGSWWLWQRGGAPPRAQANAAGGSPSPTDTAKPPGTAVPEAVIAADTPADTTAEEVLAPVGTGSDSSAAPRGAGEDQAGEPEAAQVPETKADQPTAGEKESAAKLSENPRINASLQRYQVGQVLAARQELNRMLAISRRPAEQAELRRHLSRVADATIFSRQCQPDDLLTATYTIQPGDVLINIGRQFRIPHEVIMMINGIEDATRIRAGQKIKVLRGPFQVKIHKSEFRLEVYLQDLFLRSFPVGLGSERSTPQGGWRVKERLLNPTYYPPASATNKRIIPPDDPTNPLGEHWIGLEGIEGDALGREGFGIHGTIEPESIGTAVSLGCIRMHNDDVAFLYRLMLPGHSKVTILP